MRFFSFLLLAGVAAGLAGCAKNNGPLKAYFVGSSRFTASNRTASPADTLASRFYALVTDTATQRIQRLRIEVDYSPRRAPFVYPSLLSSFLLSSVTPSTESLVYLDTTYAVGPRELLYTAVFGVRTSTGSERWTFTATDKDGNSAARTFVVSQRRSDSTAVYNDYTLKLAVPATGLTARRYLDLKSGLALPAFTVRNQPDLQALTDVIVLPDGLRLASPDALDDATYFKAGTWLKANRSHTSFYLTALTPTTFAAVTDTLSIRQQFAGAGSAQVSGLAADQVYAVRTATRGASPSVYGLMRVLNIPGGTTPGLQLQFRMAKQPL